MKIILFIAFMLALNSCSENENEASGIKRLIKSDHIEYLRKDELLRPALLRKFSKEYFYNDTDHLVEERIVYKDATLSYFYYYDEGQLSGKHEYYNGELLTSTLYEYKDHNIIKSVKRERSLSGTQKLTEKIENYYYDFQSRLVKVVYTSMNNTDRQIKMYEYISDNVIRETTTKSSNTYTIHELEKNKKNPFENVPFYDAYLKIYPILYKVTSSKIYDISGNELKDEIKIENTYSDDGFLKKNVSLHNASGHTFVTKYIYN